MSSAAAAASLLSDAELRSMIESYTSPPADSPYALLDKTRHALHVAWYDNSIALNAMLAEYCRGWSELAADERRQKRYIISEFIEEGATIQRAIDKLPASSRDRPSGDLAERVEKDMSNRDAYVRTMTKSIDDIDKSEGDEQQQQQSSSSSSSSPSPSSTSSSFSRIRALLNSHVPTHALYLNWFAGSDRVIQFASNHRPTDELKEAQNVAVRAVNAIKKEIDNLKPKDKLKEQRMVDAIEAEMARRKAIIKDGLAAQRRHEQQQQQQRQQGASDRGLRDLLDSRTHTLYIAWYDNSTQLKERLVDYITNVGTGGDRVKRRVIDALIEEGKRKKRLMDDLVTSSKERPSGELGERVAKDINSREEYVTTMMTHIIARERVKQLSDQRQKQQQSPTTTTSSSSPSSLSNTSNVTLTSRVIRDALDPVRHAVYIEWYDRTASLISLLPVYIDRCSSYEVTDADVAMGNNVAAWEQEVGELERRIASLPSSNRPGAILAESVRLDMQYRKTAINVMLDQANDLTDRWNAQTGDERVLSAESSSSSSPSSLSAAASIDVRNILSFRDRTHTPYLEWFAITDALLRRINSREPNTVNDELERTIERDIEALNNQAQHLPPLDGDGIAATVAEEMTRRELMISAAMTSSSVGARQRHARREQQQPPVPSSDHYSSSFYTLPPHSPPIYYQMLTCLVMKVKHADSALYGESIDSYYNNCMHMLDQTAKLSASKLMVATMARKDLMTVQAEAKVAAEIRRLVALADNLDAVACLGYESGKVVNARRQSSKPSPIDASKFRLQVRFFGCLLHMMETSMTEIETTKMDVERAATVMEHVRYDVNRLARILSVVADVPLSSQQADNGAQLLSEYTARYDNIKRRLAAHDRRSPSPPRTTTDSSLSSTPPACRYNLPQGMNPLYRSIFDCACRMTKLMFRLVDADNNEAYRKAETEMATEAATMSTLTSQKARATTGLMPSTMETHFQCMIETIIGMSNDTQEASRSIQISRRAIRGDSLGSDVDVLAAHIAHFRYLVLTFETFTQRAETTPDYAAAQHMEAQIKRGVEYMMSVLVVISSRPKGELTPMQQNDIAELGVRKAKVESRYNLRGHVASAADRMESLVVKTDRNIALGRTAMATITDSLSSERDGIESGLVACITKATLEYHREAELIATMPHSHRSVSNQDAIARAKAKFEGEYADELKRLSKAQAIRATVRDSMKATAAARKQKEEDAAIAVIGSKLQELELKQSQATHRPRRRRTQAEIDAAAAAAAASAAVAEADAKFDADILAIHRTRIARATELAAAVRRIRIVVFTPLDVDVDAPVTPRCAVDDVKVVYALVGHLIDEARALDQRTRADGSVRPAEQQLNDEAEAMLTATAAMVTEIKAKLLDEITNTRTRRDEAGDEGDYIKWMLGERVKELVRLRNLLNLRSFDPVHRRRQQ